jgi:membrane-associated protein
VVPLFIHITGFLFIFDAEALIRYGGLLIMCLLVYGSTGLFFCFFIPIGAILFTGGVLIATGDLDYNMLTSCSFLVLAAVAGNLTGYWFGRQAGPSLYRRKDSRFFRRRYITVAEEFYRKHGALALAAGFYLPVIRTFAPIVAGMIRLKWARFIWPTLIGAIAWIVSFVLAGYFIGSRPLLKPWLKYIVIVFILAVTIPILVKVIRGLRKR